MKLRRLSACLIAMLAAFLPLAARADYQSSLYWFAGLDPQARFELQLDLVLAGKYDRLADGLFGRGTYDALSIYQAARHEPADGVLTAAQFDDLRQLSQRKFAELGFEEVENQQTGLGIYLPRKLLTRSVGLADSFPEVAAFATGDAVTSKDGQIGLATLRVERDKAAFRDLFEALTHPDDSNAPTYSLIRDDAFTVTGTNETGNYYIRFYDTGVANVGFVLYWSDRYRETGSLLASFTASMSYPLASTGPGDAAAIPAPSAAPTIAVVPKYYSGSGFFFAGKGMIATNFHVAGRCTSLDVPGFGPARLVTGDPDLDLAVIQLTSEVTTPYASIRTEPPALAEDVVLLGYPLSDLLGSSLNVATGIVSAESGLAGQKEWFTTNAGIQPGNSGGPILDSAGHVIGVAVAKINDVTLLADAGTTAPNVGFGIKDTALLDFLSVFAHSTSSAIPQGSPQSPQQIAALGRQFTVQIICEATPG